MTERPRSPSELGDRQLLGASILVAVALTLAEYVFIPIRFPALFPDLLRELAPGIWHGSTLAARSAGDLGRWWGPLLPFLWWTGGLAMVWIAAPTLFARRLGFSARDLGWGIGSLRSKWWVYALLLLPVGLAVAWASRQPGFLSTYPMLRPDQVTRWSWTLLLLYWALYAAQFVCVEFFFRGFMLFVFAARLGRAAIGVMVVPYCMIHYHKPLPEVFGAIIAGVILGWLALETRSIWGGALLHVAVAVSMDVAAIAAGPWELPARWWP